MAVTVNNSRQIDLLFIDIKQQSISNEKHIFSYSDNMGKGRN